MRERLENDHSYLKQFQLPDLKQKSLNIPLKTSTLVKKSLDNTNHQTLINKSDRLLSFECYHPSISKNNLSSALTQTENDKLGKLIQAKVIRSLFCFLSF